MIELDKKRAFTRDDRIAIYERAKGHCQGVIAETGRACNAQLIAGRWQADHIIPHAMGGKTIVRNAQALCELCFGAKNPRDTTDVNKAKNRQASQIGAHMPAKTKIPQRPKAAKPARDKLPVPSAANNAILRRFK